MEVRACEGGKPPPILFYAHRKLETRFARNNSTQTDSRTYPHPHPQRYTGYLISYVDGLKASWGRIDAAGATAHGISLAVDVVQTFLGPLRADYNPDQEEGDEPLWRRLKWGTAIAARALDVWSARSDLSPNDMVSGRACADCCFGLQARHGYIRVCACGGMGEYKSVMWSNLPSTGARTTQVCQLLFIWKPLLVVDKRCAVVAENLNSECE